MTSLSSACNREEKNYSLAERKVLDYYKDSMSNSLKYKAIQFLVDNMDVLWLYKEAPVGYMKYYKDLRPYFDYNKYDNKPALFLNHDPLTLIYLYGNKE